MSHQDLTTDKLTHRLEGLLPDYVKDEAPVFELFLRSYFEFLESEILTLESQSDLDGIALEDGDGSLLLEPATVSPSPDQNTSKIINESTATNTNALADPFKVGEYLYGQRSGSVAKIEVINGNTLFLKSTFGRGFDIGESVIGRDGNQTAVVKKYKENTILANNRLFDYADIDHTTEEFISYFSKDFVPSLDLTNVPNKRLAIKHISQLYQKKGTEESIKFLMRILFGEDAELRYPINEVIFASDSDFNQQRRLVVVMDADTLPSATDKITKYDTDGKTVLVESVVENVYTKSTADRIYSLEVKNSHYGTFADGDAVTFLDRDGKTQYTGVIKGIISDTDLSDSSSVYVEHDDYGIILLEDGSGLTLESPNKGALYNLNDQIHFEGAKGDTDVVKAESVVNGVSHGPVTHVYIEDGGTNYNAGEIVVFDDSSTFGGGGVAIIGSVGDEILLEGGTLWGQFEVTATAGQTLVNGVDDHGNRIFFNDNLVDVYVNGILSTPLTDYSFKNDRVTFVSGLNAGDLVEINTVYNRLTYEDGTLINQETTVGNIREVRILEGGQYTVPPRVFPGGYIYFEDVSGFQVGEVVTGTNSSATATILKIEEKKNRIIVKRESTDVNVFISGEQITGADSTTQKINTGVNVSTGTGAKLFAYGENIGAVESINIQEQGYKFSESGLLSSTSYFPMLIETPTATLNRDVELTGDISGATAKVVSYDSGRHILTVTDLDGFFLDNETVSFNNVDEFRILKFSPFTGRGKYEGEGLMQSQLLGVKSTLDQDAANVQDGLYYQTHSYVVKVGESINKWRSALKDLIHPAGHIFFGEVAIKNTIDTVPEDQITFRPTIVIKSTPTFRIQLEDAARDLYSSTAERDDLSYVLFEDGNLILNEDSPDMTAMTKHEHIVLIHLDDIDMTIEIKEAGGDQSSGSPNENAHFNVNVINLFSVATTQYSPRLDEEMSVLNLVRSDDNNDYLIIQNEQRPSDQGKVFTSNYFIEEKLILEDGGLIELEEEVCKVRMEPSAGAVVKGDFGDTFILESGETLRLESATIDEPVHFFTTERSIELTDPYFITEDGHRLIFEDDAPVVNEENAEHSFTSFVPLGSTYRTLNKIAGQQTYDISYYLKDETDEDDFLLEDGTGNVLSEESNVEGIRINDYSYYFPKIYVSEFPLHERRRTNLTFSAYIKSA